VLVIDLAWWRQTHVEAQYRRIIAERGDALLLHDQDVLNIAFADSWQPIPVWFNACRFVRQHLPPAELPTVVRYLHFDGHEKPWNHPSNRWEHRVWYHAYQEAFGQPFDRRPFRRQALGLAIRHLTRTARFAIGRLRVPELW
jgi:lipopolysaccharide biosynthesis glycosyltransferase